MILQTCTTSIDGVRTSIVVVRMAIDVRTIRKAGERIGKEIVRICDNGGGVGED
jgi:hypothetical protein